MPKAVAVVDFLKLREKPDCYKEIKIGKSVFKQYSPKAIEAIKDALKDKSADEIWRVRSGKAESAIASYEQRNSGIVAKR